LGDPSYDDNRHNAVSGTESQPNWPFLAGGSIENSPAIGPAPDFTVYAGTTTTNFKLYAVRPDGTQRWAYTTAGKVHIPAAASNGSIYFGSGSGSTSGLFHGLTPAGGEKFAPVTVDGRPDTKPAIDSDGNIYICTNDYSSNVGRIYAFRPDGTLIPGWTSNPVPLPFTLLRSAALSPSGAKLIVAATDGRIRVFNTSDGGNPLDVPIDGFAGSTGDPVVVPDGSGSFWIYVRDDFRIYKLNANGAKIWSSPSLPRPGFSLSTAPAVGLGNSVYVGGFDGYLYAVSTSDGAKKWEYRVGANAIQSTPAVDGDGHIYFGSDDDHVYALTDQQTGAAIKWRYPADGQPTYGDARGKPAIHADGTVYIGTTGFRLYAINQFSAPKNFKDLLITSYAGSPVTVGGTSADSRAPVELDPGNEADWLKGKTGKRQWAVRMEVHRAASPVGGSYPYTLKAWVRQCGLEPGDCSRDVLGTFYSDTRVNYAPANRPVQLQQTIQLNAGDHGDFDRFLFGFTSATSSATAQSALIRKFQLSFIRPNDPTIGSDPSW
jgi:outer membrane protein assembly factor BamB